MNEKAHANKHLQFYRLFHDMLLIDNQDEHQDILRFYLELVCKITNTVLFQQKCNSSKINKGQIRIIPLVIASSNATKPFDFQEETLNQMTFLVKPPIAFPRISGIAFRRYGVRSLAIRDISPNLPCAIRPVS